MRFGALADLLKADRWDVVTIQQQSMAGAKAGTFEPWADFAKLARACARDAAAK